MRILVITLNAWNNANSTGNTISNLFSSLSLNDKIANIYCRNEAINNTICENYFKITENDIIKNLFGSNRCGMVVKPHHGTQLSAGTNILANNKRGDFLRRHRPTFLLLLRELIWYLHVWKNDNLDKFLKDFAPDVLYMHGHNNLYMHRLLDYCAKKTGAKIVLFWGDDMYGRKSKAPLGYIYESFLRRRYRKSISQASLLFGGSLKLCDEYNEIFKKKFTPFFKECKYVRDDKNKPVRNSITIVYAGNLLFGREQMIVKLVESIAKVNDKKIKHQFILKVFSNTNPSEKSLAILNDKTNCFFMGCKPYSEVCEEMDNSDMVLFIESFDKKNIQSTRLSFSTKIIDCMQSAAGILAIGPEEIASIDYLMRNKLGYIITDISKIEERLSYLAEFPYIIKEYNKNKVEFAKKYHTNTSMYALDKIRNIL